MGLGFLPPVTAIVTSALLVVLTDAGAPIKIAAIGVCAATVFLPRLVPAFWWSAGLIQVLLSITVVLYLRYEGFIG